MILALDTTQPTCRMVLLFDDGGTQEKQWQAERNLARDLLAQIEALLQEGQTSFTDLSGLIVLRGPGSYTGLRIGITVMNTIAYSQGIPIIGEIGERWLETAKDRLLSGENDKIVLPEYGGEPHITKAKK